MISVIVIRVRGLIDQGLMRVNSPETSDTRGDMLIMREVIRVIRLLCVRLLG